MPYRWRWPALVALLVAEAMNLLDSTIVTVAAPVIHGRLGGPAADVQWFTAAYTLPFSVLLIAGGRLGDSVGRRTVFRIGVAGFVLTSVACALAPSAGMLIGARVVQGAAAALIIPQTLGLIKEMFDGGEAARAMSTIGPVMGLAAICGPVLGGVLTHADLFGSSLRSVFLVNVPLGLAVLAATPLLPAAGERTRARLDLTGNALAVIGSALIVYPLIQWSVAAWPTMLAGVAVLGLLVLQQRRGRGTLVETSVFTNHGFAAALATSVLFFAVTTGLTLVVVLDLQLSRHLGVLAAALSLLPWSAAMAVASLVGGGWLVPRYGARVMYPGLAVLLAATILGGVTYAAGADRALLLADLALLGVGQGLFAVPFFTAALHRVRPAETGSAAGLLNAVQQLGATLGTATLGTVFLHTGGARDAFWLAAAVLLAAGVTTHLTVTDRRRGSLRRVEEEVAIR